MKKTKKKKLVLRVENHHHLEEEELISFPAEQQPRPHSHPCPHSPLAVER